MSEMDDFNAGMDAAFEELKRWETIPEKDYDDTWLCNHATSEAGVEPETHCARPVTRRKFCSSCDEWTTACAEHGVDDLSDLDMARLRKQLLPTILHYGQVAVDIERHARAADAHRRTAFNALGDQIYDMAIKMLGIARVQKRMDEVIRFDEAEATISLMVDGDVKFSLPREFFPGCESTLDIVKRICRLGVEMIAGAGHGMGYGLERMRQEHRPTVLVQCDDFAAVEDEHHKAVSAHVKVGAAAELEALNAALRMCSRPARAFRAGDHLDAYATDEHHHHDHGTS